MEKSVKLKDFLGRPSLSYNRVTSIYRLSTVWSYQPLFALLYIRLPNELIASWCYPVPSTVSHYSKMIKFALFVLLVGSLVTLSHSCKPASTVSFCKELNENYQLLERAKAVAGWQVGSFVTCFNNSSLL